MIVGSFTEFLGDGRVGEPVSNMENNKFRTRDRSSARSLHSDIRMVEICVTEQALYP